MSYGQDTDKEIIDRLYTRQRNFYIGLGVISAILMIALAVLWNPVMKPWTQERTGYANLLKAEFETKIQAEQSAAERDAAELRAQAIGIVGQVAQDYPEYRAQEFIGGFADAMRKGEISQTFYIPTVASVPVLPAMSNPVAALTADTVPAEGGDVLYLDESEDLQ